MTPAAKQRRRSTQRGGAGLRRSSCKAAALIEAEVWLCVGKRRGYAAAFPYSAASSGALSVREGQEGAVQQHVPCSAAFVASPDLQPQTLTWVVAPACAAADVYLLGSPNCAAFADLSSGGAAAAAGEHAGAAVGLPPDAARRLRDVAPR